MRWLVGILIILVLACALYVTSAVISVDRLAQAVKAGNGAEVIDRTNLDRLRRSLVDQIIAAYLDNSGKQNKPMERLLARTYGASIADALLQKMLTPDDLTKLLQTGAVTAADMPALVVPNALSIDASNLGELFGRLSWVKPVEFAVRTSQTSAPDTYSAISFHFEGSSWKLSGLTLPRAAARQLAARLPAR